MGKVAAREFRNEVSDVLNRVAYGGERIVITRRGKGVAVLVSVEDAEALEELENRLDIKQARKVLADADRKGEKPVPWKQAKKALGL
ncbi:MAG: type II toxin-antitoxin system Phd/YefM family antitoxin [Phycisphaerae bacterium]|nr:type II toxin-antitoxin system Phd/YefM family antitoxin [Phycisphaerae bacterium]